MASIPPLSEQQLKAVAKQLGKMLAGSEITCVLQRAETHKDVLVSDTGRFLKLRRWNQSIMLDGPNNPAAYRPSPCSCHTDPPRIRRSA